MPKDFFRRLRSFIIPKNTVGHYGYSFGDYYDNLNVLNTHFTNLDGIVKPVTQITFSSKKILKPFDISFDFNLQKTIKTCGKPIYTIDNSRKIPTSKTIFYKKKIGTIGLTTQLHFFEDNLFLVKTDFSTNQSSERIHQQIAKLTLEKYVESDVSIPEKVIGLKDNDSNQLTIDLLNINPSITYVTGKEHLVDRVLQFVAKEKEEHTSKAKLINDELRNKL